MILPVVLLLLVAAGGCDVDPGRPFDNTPPETYLYVQAGTAGVDTTDYRQILHWWGSDSDGEVAGYAFRWSAGWVAPPDSMRWSVDTTWVFTTATFDTFVVPIGGSYGVRTFEVRAVDDEGAYDESPASQEIRLSNSLPTVRWKTPPALPATSLPAVTFAWGGYDPDGYETVAYYRIWLESDSPTEAHVVAGDSLYTLVPADFENYGTNTVYVQAVDEAGGESAVISHTWVVEEPAGEVLLIDGVPSNDTAASTFDSFYRAQLDALAGPGNYYVFDLQRRGFRTAAEVGPTMSLFPIVVWYTGFSNNPTLEASQFRTAAAGIRDYIEGGGHIFVSSMSAIGTLGGISDELAAQAFGIQSIFVGGALATSNLILGAGKVVHPAAAWADTLKMQNTMGGTGHGVDFFTPSAAATPVYFVPPHTLDDRNPELSQDENYYLGIAREVPASGGRAILITMAFPRADARGNAAAQFAAHYNYLLHGAGGPR
jgi:hypothetical protein